MNVRGQNPEALELTEPTDAELSQRRVFPRVSDVVAPAPHTRSLRRKPHRGIHSSVTDGSAMKSVSLKTNI